ncbi:hypothetical protein HQ545_03665 [Candidatus Woesearchaeota archaeon]|nr:hypothetical protein [Candidatus Woesearchaeota archaeon]
MGGINEDPLYSGRILLIDRGRRKADRLLKTCLQGLDYVVLNNPKSPLPEEEPFDMILARELPGTELADRLKEHSPNANYIIADSMRDMLEAYRFIGATIAKRREQIDVSNSLDVPARVGEILDELIEIAELDSQGGDGVEADPILINTVLSEKIGQLKAIAQKMEVSSARPDFIGIEERIVGILKDGKSSGREKKMAKMCTRAINIIYKKGDNNRATELLYEARDIDPVIPGFLLNAIRTANQAHLARENQSFYGRFLRQQSSFTQESLRHLEESPHLSLRREPRPSRSDVAIATVDEKKYFRRANPDEELIRREAKILRFYRRLGRYIGEYGSLLQVPKVQGVVKVPNMEKWALWREYVPGVRLLDQLRLNVAELKKAEGQRKRYEKKITKKRNALMRTLEKAVTQCAYVTACGPLKLASTIEDPLNSYYNPRIQTRVLDSFDGLFEKCGMAKIKQERRDALVHCLIPIHQHLASLPADFYKDCFYGNSLITEDALSMVPFDFESVFRLPAVIDLATLLCYGGFANMLSKRTDTAELRLIENYFNTNSEAVRKFNSICDSFNSDKEEFVLDMIKQDIEYIESHASDETDSHAIQDKLALDALYKYVQDEIKIAGLHDEIFDKMQKGVQQGRLNMPSVPAEYLVDYLDEIETFVTNLECKELREIPDVGEGGGVEYVTALDNFGRDYYSALARRSLTMAAAHSDFIRRGGELEAEKQYLLFSEMFGTLGNATRGVYRFASLSSEVTLTDNQITGFRGSIQSIIKSMVYARDRLMEDFQLTSQP